MATEKRTPGVVYCEHCGREMRPLFSSMFCPNDCDRMDDTPVIISPCCENPGPHFVSGILGPIKFCANCGKRWDGDDQDGTD